MAGHLFELKEHPNNNLNVEYLLLRVHHRGQRNDPGTAGADGEGEYSNDFEVMPSEVVYRPPRRTPVPQISGLQTAIVTGPEGEEIYVDEFGRVKVQFHWDRQGEGDDVSSCWIRVSQGWAGAGFGQVYIPRIGQEVIVQFIEGDPDRPLITGRVYNGDNALPYPLPDNKTVSTMKSKSSKDDDGFNEFRFEDKAGSEEIYLHAQKDFNEEVLSCHTTDVGYDQTNTVHNNQTEQIDVDQKLTVDGNRDVEVKTNFDEKIGGTETRNVTGAVKETFESTELRKVTGAVDETFESTELRNVTGDVTENFLANETRTIGGNQTETITGNQTATITGNQTATVTGNSTATVTGAYSLTATGGITMTAPGGVKIIDTTYSWFTPKVDWFGASILEIGAYRASMIAMTIGITGMSLGTTGVSIGVTGLANSVTGVSRSATGVSVSLTGASVSVTGVEVLNHTFVVLT
jgi:type VI secretion system secreted protein VgrG